MRKRKFPGLDKSPARAIQFFESYKRHVHLFRVAAYALNDVIADSEISVYEIDCHDYSKMTQAEVYAYADRFFGTNDDSPGWEKALMHHYKNNSHHWQHWLTDYNDIGSEHNCIPRRMPEEDCLAMIADWLAASRQYSGSWIMNDWLCDNLGGHEPDIVLHKESKCFVDEFLERIGYWTNCNNAPLYCLIDHSFVRILQSHD